MDKQLLKQIIDRYKTASFNVNRIVNAMIRELMPENLTEEQHSVLQYMKARGACTSSELADFFFVGKSSITAIVTRLADKGLIQRLPDARDRRVTFLSLTGVGERLVEEMEEKIEELLMKYMIHFDDQEAKTFIETFEKLENILIQEEGGRSKV